MAEGRLIRLEENSYFLEERLKALDEQLASQQAQLEAMSKTVKLVQEQLKEIHAFLDNNRNAGSAGEIPPHHVPRLW